MTTTKFNCSIPVLGQSGLTLWNNCDAHQAQMFDFSALFTGDYIFEMKSALASAMALPDADARMAIHEAIRIEMVEKSRANLQMWQRLKRYCTRAWNDSEEMLETKLVQAGWRNYIPNNWTAIQSLNQSATNFMTANLSQLSDVGLMPATFPEQYAAIAEEFSVLLNTFMAAQLQSKEATAQRNALLNSCYTSLIMMCEDAQQVFVNNESIKEQFVFDRIVSMIAPDNGSTAAFEIVDDATNKPIMAQIENEQSERVIVANAAGRGEMGHLPQGPARFNITADEYTQLSVTQTMNGTRSIIRVRMDKVSTATTTAPAPEAVTTDELTTEETAN